MTRARAALLVGLLAAVAAAGCGKKGPPLAPLRPAPQTISTFTTKRMGQTVYVRITVPTLSADGKPSTDLDRIDVYAFTGRNPNELDDPKLATPIASIQVKQIFPADQEEKWKTAGVPPPPNPGVDVGGVADVAETLTDAAMVPVARKIRIKPPVVVEPAPNVFGHLLELPLTGPVIRERPLRRFYLAQGVSRKKVKGAMSPIGAVLLREPPPAPVALEGTVAEAGLTLAWSPSPDQRLPIQEPAPAAVAATTTAVTIDPPPVLAGTTKGMLPEPVFTYNVYVPGEVPIPATGALPIVPYVPNGDPLPVPFNPAPLAVLTYQDTTMVFGTERCYVVRAVETLGDAALESAASDRFCVTPVDTFPPPAPASVSAVAAEGAISLIWDAVQAKDLAGYLVLRSEGSDKPLVPLFEEPIKETTYRDATAKPGVRYSYAIASVDTATPRNVSAPSARVEDAAR